MKLSVLMLIVYTLNFQFLQSFKHYKSNEPILDKLENFEKGMAKIINDIENTSVNNKTFNFSLDNFNNTNRLNKHKMKMRRDEEKFNGDYVSQERTIRFFIDNSLECSVNINDTATYKELFKINFIEHMILHNNADGIDHKGVYSEDLDISYFSFNKKLNTFNVYFENKRRSDYYTIEYDYEAVNLIKTSTSNSFNKLNRIEDNLKVYNFNNFIWKIINQNFIQYKEKINIEIIFNLGETFDPKFVELNLKNYTFYVEIRKPINKHDHEIRTTYVFKWSGLLQPQEVLVLNAKFPLYFENCGDIKANGFMIIIGAIFIILLIGMLYIIISTVFCEDF